MLGVVDPRAAVALPEDRSFFAWGLRGPRPHGFRAWGFPTMCWTPSDSTRLRWALFWTNTGAVGVVTPMDILSAIAPGIWGMYLS